MKRIIITLSILLISISTFALQNSIGNLVMLVGQIENHARREKIYATFSCRFKKD